MNLNKNKGDKGRLRNLIFQQSESWKVKRMRTNEELFPNIIKNAKIANDPKSRKLQIRRGIMVAASVVVLLVMSVFLYQETIETGLAERRDVVLPDGSEVIMDAETKLTYNKLTWKFNKSLSLVGKARFKVIKGEKFKVVTNKSVVQVLGTIFDVEERVLMHTVSCYEGKVSVSYKGSNKEEFVSAGEMLLLDGDRFLKSTLHVSGDKSWTSGMYHFENCNIKHVLNELQRQYKIEIRYTGDKNRLFSGSFVKEDLDTALQMVCLPMNLKYSRQANTVLVQSNAE